MCQPGKSRRLAALVTGLGLLASMGGCGSPAEKPAAAAPWNVVVLMVDTLRADRLSFYGYGRPTAPRLAELARSGVVFREARSQAGCTYPSVSSILTSRWPQHFLNGQDTHGMAIPPGTPSVAELLERSGYATAAVSASIVVRKTPSRVNRQGGFGRGFQSFDESCLERAADCVNERAGSLLDRLPEPFFLYLHYLDPHQPYQPPADHPRRFAPLDTQARRWVRRGNPNQIVRHLYEGDPKDFEPADAEYLSDLYDDEIAYLDARLAELFDRLRRGGRLERTIVVLLSDHGEELLDHGEWGHCRNLAYETVLHTPLVFWIPGGPRGERSGLALNVDVVPTLLDLLGLAHAPGAFAGKSLRPLLEHDRPVHEAAFALQGASRVATDGRYKLWLDLGGAAPRLFDLLAGEARATEPKVAAGYDRRAVARLRSSLLGWMDQQEGGRQADNLRRARENTAQLKALGYL
jgi:arylsulfatase